MRGDYRRTGRDSGRDRAQSITRGHSYRTYDWERATALGTDIMSRYDLAGSRGRTGEAG